MTIAPISKGIVNLDLFILLPCNIITIHKNNGEAIKKYMLTGRVNVAIPAKNPINTKFFKEKSDNNFIEKNNAIENSNVNRVSL
jgi:hypothetical protein